MKPGALLVLAAALVAAGCHRGQQPPPDGIVPQGRVLSADEAEIAELLVLAAENGRPEQARRALDVLGPSPAGPRSALLAARALLAREPADMGGALEAVATARKAGAASIDASQVEGMVAFMRGDAKALGLLEPTLDAGPFPGRACLAVGRLAFEAGDLDRAVRLAERAGLALPGSADPPFLLASIHAARQDVAAQRAALDSAVAIDPTHAGARAGRALLLSRTGAAEDHASAGATDRAVQALLAQDLDLRLAAKDPAVVKEARLDVTSRLAELEPERWEWRIQRAEMLFGARDPAVALAEIRGVAPRLTRPLSLGLAARLALRCDDCALASELARRALADPLLDTNSLIVRALPRGALGTCMLREGDAHGGLPMLREAVALTPWEGELRASLAEALRASGREDEADRELRLALRLEPDSARIRALTGVAAGAPGPLGPPPLSDRELARLLVDAADLGGTHDSTRALALLATVSPDDADVELLRARALLAEVQADRGSARLALQRAREKGGDPREVAVGLGLIAYSLGERVEATRNLTASLTGLARDVPALLRLGQLALEDGDLPAAVRHLEQAEALAPSAEVAFQLSRVHAAGSDPVAQRRDLDEVLARDPEHLGARLARARLAAAGSAEDQAGRRDALINSLLARDNDLAGRRGSDIAAMDDRLSIALQLAEAEPSIPAWRLRWARLLMEKRQGERASRLLRQAAPLFADRSDLGRAARIAYQCEDYALAEELGQKALQRPAQPPLPPLAESDLLATVGACLLRRGQAAEARPLLQRAAELVPYQHSIRSLLAMACAGAGDAESAMREYRIALQLQPGQVRVLTELGTLLRSSGRAAAALDFLEEACRLMPGAAQAQAQRGLALVDLGRIPEAVDALQAAAAAAPGDVEIPYRLGLLLMQSGQAAAAIPWLERAAASPTMTDAPLLLEIARRDAKNG